MKKKGKKNAEKQLTSPFIPLLSKEREIKVLLLCKEKDLVLAKNRGRKINPSQPFPLVKGRTFKFLPFNKGEDTGGVLR